APGARRRRRRRTARRRGGRAFGGGRLGRRRGRGGGRGRRRGRGGRRRRRRLGRRRGALVLGLRHGREPSEKEQNARAGGNHRHESSHHLYTRTSGPKVSVFSSSDWPKPRRVA